MIPDILLDILVLVLGVVMAIIVSYYCISTSIDHGTLQYLFGGGGF